MSRNLPDRPAGYKFHNPEGIYLPADQSGFVSFAVVEWIDALSRKEYKDIIVDSLTFCQKEKGMVIFAWCIMSNHVHLIFKSIKERRPELLIGDLKRFTSKAIVKAIKENPQESRKEWMLAQFEKAAIKTSNVKTYQFWRHDNKPIELWSNNVIDEKIRYLPVRQAGIHNNPVEEGLVFNPEDYVYSSAKDYCSEKGILNGVFVVV